MHRVTRTIPRAILATLVMLGLVVTTGSPAQAAGGTSAEGSHTTVSLSPAEVAAELATGTARAADVRTAAANVCGSGYTRSGGAERIVGSDGVPVLTAYSWIKDISGNGYYDDPTCGVVYSEGHYAGTTMYISATLCDNYTSTACDTDAGYYTTYAGPVYQSKGVCGMFYFFMKRTKSGGDIARGQFMVGSCN